MSDDPSGERPPAPPEAAPGLTPLDDILAGFAAAWGETIPRVTTSPEDEAVEAHLPADWTQGRTIYGGLSVLAALRLARSRAPLAAPLRGLTAQFVRPVRPGPVRLRRRRLGTGASVMHEQVELLQRDKPCVLATFTFGAARDPVIVREGPARPALPDRKACDPLGFEPGLTPEFTRHLDYRFRPGTRPFVGAAEPALGGWFRLRAPTRLAGEELVVFLADAWPAAALPAARVPGPAATVSWWLSLTPAAAAAEATGEGWFAFEGAASQADLGYASAGLRVWGPDGALLAEGSQLDAVYPGG